MSLELPYLTALVLGTVHAFEADHLAAVTSFAVQRPRARDSVGFGFRWALGHGSAILVAGVLLIFIGLKIPASLAGGFERAAGIALIALGGWTIFAMRRLHAHEHVHDGVGHVHLHSHLFRRDHAHAHGPIAMGLLHGLAGAAPAVALIPLALFDTAIGGLTYLLLFAAGTATAMSIYAALVGALAGRANRLAASFGRAVGQLTGVGTLCIGVFWLIR